MKSIMIAIAAFSLLGTACAAGTKTAAKTAVKAAQYVKYSMDNGYFTCSVPSGWELKRDKDNDEKYRIYEIELVGTRSGKVSTTIYVSYYAQDNEDFNDYKDFVHRNSTNALGETSNAREQYSPVKNIKLAGRAGFLLERARSIFLHPESKSDESADMKEKLYILPAKEGFFVLHFTADKAFYDANLKVFEKVAASFKGKI